MTGTVVYYLNEPNDSRLARVVMFNDGALAIQFVDPDHRRCVLEEHHVRVTTHGGEHDLLMALVELGIIRQIHVEALRMAWRPDTDPRTLPEEIAELWWLVAALHHAADELVPSRRAANSPHGNVK